MKCTCNKELISEGDHTYEDYGEEGEGVVSKLHLRQRRM